MSTQPSGPGGVRLRERFQLPLYEAQVQVVVADDIDAAYQAQHGDSRGDIHLLPGGHTMYNLDTGRFEVWLTTEHATLNIVTHELFHLSHRISQWASLHFDDQHHEATAVIHGWLCEKILVLLGLAQKSTKKRGST